MRPHWCEFFQVLVLQLVQLRLANLNLGLGLFACLIDHLVSIGRIDTLTLRFYQVEHGLDHPWRSKYLAMVGYTLF